MKLKDNLEGRPPKVPFEFHELCYRGEPRERFSTPALWSVCNASMHAARSRGRAGKFTMHGSRLEIRDPESTGDQILNL